MPSRRPFDSRLRIEPTSVSTINLSSTRCPGNSSGISDTVAPTALPMPSARWPAFLPIVTMKYQRDVVRASTSRSLTIPTPT